MARLRITRRAMERISSGFCWHTDVRVLLKDGDEGNVSFRWDDGTVTQAKFSGPREMRSLARQLDAIADYFEQHGRPLFEIDEES